MRALLLILSLLISGLTTAAEISGRIELYADGKALRPDEAQDAIVYFRPKEIASVTPASAPYTMSTRHKQFFPRVLAITVGSQVRFPNEDPILHNAFSTSKDNAFDVGLYGEGDGQIATFSHPGYVRVYCNVHHSMIGHILVLDTPYFTHPDTSGSFHLANLPAVPGDIVIWQERASPWHAVVTPGKDVIPDLIKLELTQRRVPPHMNKFGQPYGRGNDGGY